MLRTGFLQPQLLLLGAEHGEQKGHYLWLPPCSEPPCLGYVASCRQLPSIHKGRLDSCYHCIILYPPLAMLFPVATQYDWTAGKKDFSAVRGQRKARAERGQSIFSIRNSKVSACCLLERGPP